MIDARYLCLSALISACLLASILVCCPGRLPRPKAKQAARRGVPDRSIVTLGQNLPKGRRVYNRRKVSLCILVFIQAVSDTSASLLFGILPLSLRRPMHCGADSCGGDDDHAGQACSPAGLSRFPAGLTTGLPRLDYTARDLTVACFHWHTATHLVACSIIFNQYTQQASTKQQQPTPTCTWGRDYAAAAVRCPAHSTRQKNAR